MFTKLKSNCLRDVIAIRLVIHNALGITQFCPSTGSSTLTGSVGVGESIQWYKNNSSISGATSSTYIATTSGTYDNVVSNGTCTDGSPAVTISYYNAPFPSIGTSDNHFCENSSILINANIKHQ